MQSITDKINRIDTHFRQQTDTPEQVRLLQRAVKLNEEVGELCEAILCESDPNQRDKQKEIDFAGELADVAICLLMIAKSKDTDLWEAVDNKLEKVLGRL